jgi:acetate kinase
MLALTVNAGSSSVRLAAFVREGAVLRACGAEHHGPGSAAPSDLLQSFAARHLPAAPQRVAHRIVHGGPRLTSTRAIDSAVEAEIDRLTPLAPLHHPAALAWVRACREAFGADVPQVAVFDTAFFAAMPAVATTYALPWQLAEAHGLRRYGFHGIAHQALWSRWRELRPDVPEGGRVISFQLGAGCSVTAVDRGAARDTSMGFSPLEGLVMATRSGDVDPALVTYLQRVEGLDAADIERLLYQRSGLLGLSGISGDMRELLGADDARARLAVDVFCHRARKVLGAYLAVLGGADAVLFGGGIGENAAVVRARIAEGLGWAGLSLDAQANADAVGREARISSAGSAIEAWVIAVDEARVLAREAFATPIA